MQKLLEYNKFGSIDTWQIRRRMRQLIVSPYTKLREELDAAVLEALPLSPRGAKRMFNHAHLLLDIGVGRGIFENPRRLEADQLAVWVALTERWPSVAAAITADPMLMRRLEYAARQAAPNLIEIAGLDSDLLDYLKDADTGR